jgi:hypothetical protein
MNRNTISGTDPDKLLKQAFREDLPPDAEARMRRQFLNLKRNLDRPECSIEADAWSWIHRVFHKEILTLVSVVLLAMGIVMQFSGAQSALAHSIGQLKVIMTISMNLNRAVSMDCTVLKPAVGGENSSYHVRWRANGDVRVDRDSGADAQTVWLSEEAISFAGSDGSLIRSMSLQTITPGPAWQPAMEFKSPAHLAKDMEGRYGLMQAERIHNTGSAEFLIVGHEDRQTVEITIDERTYLPKALKKYALDSGRTNRDRICLMEARFQWNQPISDELFVSGPQAGK